MPNNNNNDYHLVYFTHRELVALVEHADSEVDVISFLANHPVLERGEGYDTLCKQVTVLQGLHLGGKSTIESICESEISFGIDTEQSKVLSFSSSRGTYSSLVFFPVDFAGELSAEATARLEHEIDDEVHVPLQGDDAFLLYLVGELNRRIIVASNDETSENLPVLKAVSLNWLLGGAPSQVSTGGPGSKPVPPVGSGAANNWAFVVSDSGLPTPRATRPQQFPGYADFRDGFNSAACPNPVKVVLLDTAPSQARLASASTKFGAQNALFSQLIAPGGIPTGNFEIVYYDDSEDKEFKDTYGLKEHNYDMADHGLFIAGIVRTLAPEAQLELIQVLNDYGVGSIKALSAAVDRLKTEHAQQAGMAMVVNSSLTITFPFEESQIDSSGQSFLDDFYKLLLEIYRELGLEDEFKEALVGHVSALYYALRQCGMMLFAAAGNDGDKNSGKEVEARFPAAFPGVYGVGARDADYSNEADKQPEEGFLAFGGDPNNLGTDGILGLYTREKFPKDGSGAQQDNDLGLARWAGTSFATAIVTGTFVRLVCRGCDSDTARQYMQQAVIETGVSKGNVLPVKQGQ